MIKLDTRRLTGINVIWKKHGAVADVRLNKNENADDVIGSWHRHARELLDALGWNSEETRGYRMHSGVALAISAPVDALYAAVEAVEWILHQVRLETARDCDEEPLEGEQDYVVPDHDFHSEVERLKTVIADEHNPALCKLMEDAQQHQVTLLTDDDEVSAGLGRFSKTWPIDQIPDTADWAKLRDVPVGLVTGTNGKTTTVRLTQRMLRAANQAVGISSTDWIGVDDTIIDRGDYSGPGGARAVLRQHIDAAVLETARGGLLRRGLGVPRADAALITNIAEDHLGDFGSENLQELLNLKWIVTQALDKNSIAILNAEDSMLVAKASSLDVPICWFALRADNEKIATNIQNSQPVVTVIDGEMSRYDGSQWHQICPVVDAPITVQGTAPHNVANALGAIALAHTLGAPDDAIRIGLQQMTPNENPGRCNFFTVNGVEVLLDFAHNPSAMQAIFSIAAHRSSNKRFLCFGQAGDRTDESIRELASNAWAIGLEHVFISELGDYRRGRGPNEVFELLSEGLTSAGAASNQISHFEFEHESLTAALEMAAPGDLVIMLALGEARSILQWLGDNTDAG